MDDRLLQTLFVNAEDGSKHANDPEFARYLAELAANSAKNLTSEPDRLAHEMASLHQATENLAFSHYKTFIQAANCSKEIYDDFTVIEGQLSRVLDHLPTLNHLCQEFLSQAQQIGSKRQANSLTMSKHTQILELLEIPQVMDTCVKGGYYEEALELANYVGKLQRRLNHIPIIIKIAEEVHLQRDFLVNQLMEQLYGQLNLPQCLKIISYLRRLSVFTEAELRVKFLSARDSWLQKQLNAVPKDDAYQHITKIMELSRSNLFDIVTQYRAAFADDDPLAFTTRDPNLNELALFQGWLMHRIQKFLEILREDLHRGVGGRMDSILAQAMYFGLSFGRIGADFRGLLAPVFEEAILEQFMHFVSSAEEKFSKMLNKAGGVIFHRSSTASQISTSASSKDDATQPPNQLMECPALAVYTNELLNGLNEIRLCLPMTLAREIVGGMERSLTRIAQRLANLTNLQISQQEKNAEDGALLKFEGVQESAEILVEILLPYLNRCLMEIFPRQQLASALGLSIALDAELISSFLAIDATNVFDLLKDFLHKNPGVPIPGDEIEKIPHESDRLESIPDESISLDDNTNASVELKEVKFD